MHEKKEEKKEGIFCRNKSVAITLKSRDLLRHSGESLQNGQLEL